MADALRVDHLAADEPDAGRQDLEAAREHQRALGRCVMNACEIVRAFDLADLRSLDHDRTGSPAEVDRVDDDEGVRARKELLDEVDPSDPDIQDLHFCGRLLLEQAVGDGDAKAVVAPEDVADSRDDDPHVGEDRDVLDPITELQQRVARYDEARYPVQHATARYHLGVVLTDVGRFDEALESLAHAAELFAPELLPVEHAKTLNALGAARRLVGELDTAAVAFERAAELFEAAGLEQERGAALFNLGLVSRGRDPQGAAECFRSAAGLVAGAADAAVLRELGATLLELGELEEAASTLERALELAERGEAAGYGGAANALGLVHLAAGRPKRAIESFRQAAGAHPRSVRPAEFAMAKANLALAHELVGDLPRARLAARQALGVAGSPPPVVAQAEELLNRVGAAADDLRHVLAQEPVDRWESLVREEVVRVSDAPVADQRAAAATWIDGSSVELAQAWLGALLELPPEIMELHIRSALETLHERDVQTKERFRADVSQASSRFHVPQLLRLEETFRRLAAELSEPWS